MYWIILLIIVILLITFKITNSVKYFAKRNIIHKKSWPLLGNFQDLILQRRNVAYVIEDFYKDKDFSDKRYYGLYQLLSPTIILKDLDLIKRITVKDFDHFVDHMNFSDQELEPIFGKNLLMLRGQKWKDMRNTLSPSFTGNKIRIMFNLISECSNQFNDYLLGQEKEIVEVDLKDMMSRLAMDVIATCTFGVQCDSIKEDSEFYKMGMKLTTNSFTTFLKAMVQMLTPSLAKTIGISVIPKSSTKFFEATIKETLKVREEQHIIRPDMIHIMMEARKNQKAQEDVNLPDTGFAAVDHGELKHDKPDGHSRHLEQELTTDDIVAQGILFFLAGFETVSTLMSHVCNELAINPDVQEKLQQEIDDAMEKTNHNLNYELLVKMKYLDMVVSETLRKWPPAVLMNRECVKDYKIESSDRHGENEMTIEKGVGIMIPVYGIHRDPKYYPNPEKFDPDRFNDENKHKILPYTYLPFGAGPRNCIGSRFALLEAKVIIAHLLSKFDLVVVEKTQIPLILSRKVTALYPENGFWLGLKRRKL